MKTLLPQGFSSYVHSLVSCGYLPISRQVCQKSARNRPHDIHRTFSETGKRAIRGSKQDTERRSRVLLSSIHAAAGGSPNRLTGIRSRVSFRSDRTMLVSTRPTRLRLHSGASSKRPSIFLLEGIFCVPDQTSHGDFPSQVHMEVLKCLPMLHESQLSNRSRPSWLNDNPNWRRNVARKSAGSPRNWACSKPTTTFSPGCSSN